MEKTTVYLPADLKAALKRLARRRRSSEAELLRQAVIRFTEQETESPEPRLPLFRASGRPIAEDIDEALKGGFGS
jgi:Arc/MetJ-type ribon-helix-helix transcriptional regulator